MFRKFLVSLLFTSTLFSQTLTLSTSIEKALHHHPEIQASTLKVIQAEHAYDAVFSDYLPQIDLHANYNPQQTFVFPQNGAFHTLDDKGWSAGASLRQKIWDFSKTSSQVAASKVDKTISTLSLKETKALLVYQVKLLYELMVVQKEAIKVRQKDLEAKEALYQQSLAFEQQGLKTAVDSSRFLSSLSLAKANLAESQAEFLKAKNSLSLYMGEPIEDDVSLQTEILTDTSTLHQFTLKKVIKENYALQVRSFEIQKNRLLHRSAQASHFGSIDAIASYDHISSLNTYDSKLLGLSLNIPLYSGGRVNAQAQGAAVGIQIASEQKSLHELQLAEQTQNLLEDIKKFSQTIQAKEAQLEASTQTSKLLRGRYKEGIATYIEVLDAIALELDAKLGLLSAQYQRSSALHQLEYLEGKIQ